MVAREVQGAAGACATGVPRVACKLREQRSNSSRARGIDSDAYQLHHVALQRIDALVRMTPRIRQRLRVEGADELPDVRQLEQPRLPGNEQPNPPLNRRDVTDQSNLVDDVQQIAVAVEGGPRRERDKRRRQRQANVAAGARGRDEVRSRVPLSRCPEPRRPPTRPRLSQTGSPSRRARAGVRDAPADARP